MPYDSEVTKLQGEIAQLEKEIAAIQMAKNYVFAYSPISVSADTIKTLTGISARLQDSLEHKELKLSMHRQKTSGVKY